MLIRESDWSETSCWDEPPLGNGQGIPLWSDAIDVENHHFLWVNINYKLPFAIVMLNYQRGTFLMSLDMCFQYVPRIPSRADASPFTPVCPNIGQFQMKLETQTWKEENGDDFSYQILLISISSHHFYRILWSWSGEAKIQASDHCNSRSTSCRMGLGIVDPTGLWNNASGPRNCNNKIKEHWEIAGWKKQSL